MASPEREGCTREDAPNLEPRASWRIKASGRVGLALGCLSVRDPTRYEVRLLGSPRTRQHLRPPLCILLCSTEYTFAQYCTTQSAITSTTFATEVIDLRANIGISSKRRSPSPPRRPTNCACAFRARPTRRCKFVLPACIGGENALSSITTD